MKLVALVLVVLACPVFGSLPTRLNPIEPDGSPAPVTAKVFQWSAAECVLDADDKALSLVAKGKDFRDGKLYLTVADYDTTPVEVKDLRLVDQNEAVWSDEKCEVKVTDKEFEKGKLAKAKLHLRCMSLVPVEGKEGEGKKGYYTPEDKPVVCESIKVTSARQP